MLRRYGIPRLKTLATANQKGGAGKTTVALNLAAALVELGRRVLVIDADPQRSATRCAIRRSAEALVPIHPLPIEDEQDIGRLSAELRRLARDHQAGYMLIDCPPGLETATIAAFLLADMALVPVTPSALDLWAVEKALDLVADARQTRGGILPRVALVPNRLICGTVMARELPGTLEDFGELVTPGITQRVALAEATIVGQAINEYAPGSKAHKEFLELARFTVRALGERL